MPARNYSDAMLQHIIEEATRALKIQDPAGRADVISSQLQPYSGWALRWAVEDCRARGMTWQTIAGMLGRSYPALIRQYEAGGPIYTVTPAQSPTSGNFDAQTPLRRAATAVAQHMVGLGMTESGSPIYAALHELADRLATAQCTIDDPADLLDAARELLAAADEIRSTVRLSKPERETWATVEHLRACYERDHAEIETAHEVLSAVAKLQAADEDQSSRKRPLRMRVVEG
jgi:hypothetical protein